MSHEGDVYSRKSGKTLKSSLTSGYPVVTLRNPDGRKEFRVHRLVATAFLPNTDGLPVVHHKNGNKLDHVVSNLEWVTYQQNSQFACDAGSRCPGRPVLQLSRAGELVERYSTVTQASVATGAARSSISDCCVGRQKSAVGYRWVYEKDKETMETTSVTEVAGVQRLSCDERRTSVQ